MKRLVIELREQAPGNGQAGGFAWVYQTQFDTPLLPPEVIGLNDTLLGLQRIGLDTLAQALGLVPSRAAAAPTLTPELQKLRDECPRADPWPAKDHLGGVYVHRLCIKCGTVNCVTALKSKSLTSDEAFAAECVNSEMPGHASDAPAVD